MKNTDGFLAECQQGREMGFDGKTLIHPGQVEGANEAFAPSTQAVEDARGILQAWEDGAGSGVVTYNGRMIENLHVESAQRTLTMHEAIIGPRLRLSPPGWSGSPGWGRSRPSPSRPPGTPDRACSSGRSPACRAAGVVPHSGHVVGQLFSSTLGLVHVLTLGPDAAHPVPRAHLTRLLIRTWASRCWWNSRSRWRVRMPGSL